MLDFVSEMPISQEFQAKMTEVAWNLGMRFVESWIQAPKKPKTPSPDKDKGDCSTCAIHRNIVLARGYIEGLSTRLNPDGSVPAGLGGTIEQARVHVRESMLEIPEVVGSHPQIDAACRQLTTILPDIAARLENIQGQEQWDHLVAKLKLAEEVSYAIPEAIYRRDVPKGNLDSEDGQKIVVLKAEEAEILETLGKVKRHELSAQQARESIAKILG